MFASLVDTTKHGTYPSFWQTVSLKHGAANAIGGARRWTLKSGSVLICVMAYVRLCVHVWSVCVYVCVHIQCNI